MSLRGRPSLFLILSNSILIYHLLTKKKNDIKLVVEFGWYIWLLSLMWLSFSLPFIPLIDGDGFKVIFRAECSIIFKNCPLVLIFSLLSLSALATAIMLSHIEKYPTQSYSTTLISSVLMLIHIFLISIIKWFF